MTRISKALLLLPLILNVVACGNSDTPEQNKQVEASATITAPKTAEEGSVVIFSVASEQPYDVSVSGVNNFESLGDDKFRFISKNVQKEVQEAEISVTSGGKEFHHTIDIEPMPIPLFAELPRGYPLESGNISKHARHARDDNGVTLLEYNGELYYYHVQISKVAQVYYHYIKANDLPVEETEDFLAMARWLRDNCEYTELGFCSWRADVDLSYYKVPTSWTSAMAQGQAITVLLGAYAITNDDSYYHVLSDALAAFNYSVEEKGVTADFAGVPFYQEYGSEEAPANVLNGFLFSLAGLYDIADLTGSQTARQAFEVGVDSLEAVIEEYDMGFTSRYDYSHLNQISSAMGGGDSDGYHEIHISQLAWLYTVSEAPYALEYLKKFLKYDTNGIKSLPQLKDSSRKIVEVEASSSIAPSTHGPEYIWDSNWTWKRYWSSNKAVTNLRLKLNNGSANMPIELGGFRLTSVNEETVPKSIAVYDCVGSDRKLILDNLMTESLVTEYAHNVNGYTSLTLVFEFDAIELECSDIELDFTIGEAGYFTVRELSPYIEQPEIVDALLGFFDELK
ncbi:D-glucuronyl C5-epimerase family protein [Pseudidiomarina salilacus]|uniref:D-glucuronyl C5-epimerase family protein n=1 Tax=Pseudidiomarina salilacus TaxID=3384452 RepID=UPI0039851467